MKLVRVWMAERDLTQVEMARLIGVAAPTLSEAMTIETVGPELLLRLMSATGLPLAELAPKEVA